MKRGKLRLAADNGLVIARGMVTRGGMAVAGAQVDAGIWPSAEELARASDGPVDVRWVAKVRTDTAGRYEIAVDPVAVPATHRDANGNVDVQLSVADGGQATHWNFTTVWEKGAAGRAATGWSATYRLAQGGPRAGEFRFDLGAKPSVVEVGRAPARYTARSGAVTLTAPDGPIRSTADSRAVPAASDSCYVPVATNQWMRNQREVFDIVSAWEGAPITYEQSVVKNSTHTLSLAYKPIGDFDWI